MLVVLPRGAKDLAGREFGKLIPQYIVDVIKGAGVVWRCLCECGAAHDVLARELLRGNTRQCPACVTEARRANMRAVGSRERVGPADQDPDWRDALAGASDAQRRRYVEILQARWKRGIEITDELKAEAIEVALMEVAA